MLWRGSRTKTSVARTMCLCSHVPNSFALIGCADAPFNSQASIHAHSLTRTLTSHTLSSESHKSQALRGERGGFVVIPLQLNLLHFSYFSCILDRIQVLRLVAFL